jgi:hypothetical protein
VFCPYVSTCFADWQRPELDELLDEADVVLVDKLAHLADSLATARAAVNRLEAEQAELRDQLEGVLPMDGTEVAAGPYVVKVTEFEKTSVRLSEFTKAGNPIPAVLMPYVKASRQRRWTIKEA